MNLFDKSKIEYKSTLQKNCKFCGVKFVADSRNVKRGWGLFCSKSCSTLFRNKLKLMSESEKVKIKRNIKLEQLGIE